MSLSLSLSLVVSSVGRLKSLLLNRHESAFIKGSKDSTCVSDEARSSKIVNRILCSVSLFFVFVLSCSACVLIWRCLIVCASDAAIFAGLLVVVVDCLGLMFDAALILMNCWALVTAKCVSYLEVIGVAFAFVVPDSHQLSTIQNRMLVEYNLYQLLVAWFELIFEAWFVAHLD